MLATLSERGILVVKRRASMCIQGIYCPQCGRYLCAAQILCIIEIKCRNCRRVVRIEPVTDA